MRRLLAPTIVLAGIGLVAGGTTATLRTIRPKPRSQTISAAAYTAWVSRSPAGRLALSPRHDRPTRENSLNALRTKIVSAKAEKFALGS
jgi:hypothetical protein